VWGGSHRSAAVSGDRGYVKQATRLCSGTEEGIMVKVNGHRQHGRRKKGTMGMYGRPERVSTTISIEIPREIMRATRMTPQELKQDLAIFLFQQGKLSFGKAREMADMSVWAFQQLLGSRGIPVHYDIEEYEEDLQTLRELGRQ
jgi:predicted HTH domain antitoxin